MRFVSRIDVYLPADVLERSPGMWDHFKALWAPVDLRTDRVRNRLEAATFVYEFRGVLDALGIDNARSLVVDGVTVFHDARGVENDLPDLVLSLTDHVSVFGERCQELCFSVEHEEAGLGLVIEATVTSEHPADTPSARIAVVGQLVELDPRPGEGAEAYRRRVAPFVSDPKVGTTVRLQYGAFVSRMEAALARAFPETRFVVTTEVVDASDLATDEPPPLHQERRAPGANTAAPARNFTLGAEQRIAALVGGPPQFAVRQRKIEDLEEELLAALGACEAAGATAIPIAVARGIEELNRLIGDHNRYYPIERNLPIDAATGQLLEMGEPWMPRAAVTIDGLRRRARRVG